MALHIDYYVSLNSPWTHLGAARIERAPGHAIVIDSGGRREVFDDVVLATHADEALALLAHA